MALSETIDFDQRNCRPLRRQFIIKTDRRYPMKMLIDLFSTDYGLMSLGVIAFILLMAAFFVRMFVQKMNNNE